MSKKKLGRDLGSLLSGAKGGLGDEANEDLGGSSDLVNPDLRHIELGLITPSSYQPRQTFSAESLSELSESIRQQGLLQPILVRVRAQGGYELIAGERRWRAAKLAGLKKIPAIIREAADREASALALVENIQRDNLNVYEEAAALGRLRDEFQLTQEDIALAVGRSRAAVANLLRLLLLGEAVKGMLKEGVIEMGHARALLGLENLDDQESAAQELRDKSLSVRQTEALVKKIKDAKFVKSGLAKPTGKNRDVMILEQQLGDFLGAKTMIKTKRQGSGEMIVQYSSLEELEGIFERIGLERF